MCVCVCVCVFVCVCVSGCVNAVLMNTLARKWNLPSNGVSV